MNTANRPLLVRRFNGGYRASIRLAALLGAIHTPHALAQCDGAWLPGFGRPGVNNLVTAAAMWDPDGEGPLTSRLVIGGQFSQAGGHSSPHAISWDPGSEAWIRIGVPGWPYDFLTLPNGDLIAAGASGWIGRWDGEAWTLLDERPNGTILALALLHDGSIVAGGPFTEVGGQLVNCIARWDGAAWSSLGSGMGGRGQYTRVNDLVVLATGELIATGSFTTAGDEPANFIASWDGAMWSPLGEGLGWSGSALALMPNGELVVGGEFTDAGGAPANNIAVWNGTAWSTLGEGLDREVNAICVLPNGDLIAGGDFRHAGGVEANHIARWNGSEWLPLGLGTEEYGVLALTALPSGELFAGGYFHTAGELLVNNVARWDGEAWHTLGGGPDRYGSVNCRAIAETNSGDIVISGAFTHVGGRPANRIARWDGSAWTALGTGLDNSATALLELSNGDLVAGGLFTQAGDQQVGFIAKWNGTVWTGFEADFDDYVDDLALAPNGRIIAAGSFRYAGVTPVNGIAEWDGTAWSSIGGGTDGSVYAMLLLDDGTLIAGGSFSGAGGVEAHNIAVWDGQEWSPLGLGTDRPVSSLATLPDGRLVAGGTFRVAGGAPANGIAVWDGFSWLPLGEGLQDQNYLSANALSLAPNGDLIVGGSFDSAGGQLAENIARWDGESWSALGWGTDDHVLELALLESGDILASGSFSSAGRQPSAGIAFWRDPSEPRVTEQPVDCIAREGADASFTIRAYGSLPLSLRWRYGESELTDGPTPHGSTIDGAATDTLTIYGVHPQDGGEYSCMVSNACGSVLSDPALLTVTCAADLNGDGEVDTRDVIAFLNLWAAGDLEADFDDNGVIDTRDVIVFLNEWNAGC